MAKYRVTCTEKSAFAHHHHIVRVGATDESGKSRTWSVKEVRDAIDRGDIFETCGKSKKTAGVDKFSCQPCKFATIRSNPDEVTDNNLDDLPKCG